MTEADDSDSCSPTYNTDSLLPNFASLCSPSQQKHSILPHDFQSQKEDQRLEVEETLTHIVAKEEIGSERGRTREPKYFCNIIDLATRITHYNKWSLELNHVCFLI